MMVQIWEKDEWDQKHGHEVSLEEDKKGFRPARNHTRVPPVQHVPGRLEEERIVPARFHGKEAGQDPKTKAKGL